MRGIPSEEAAGIAQVRDERRKQRIVQVRELENKHAVEMAATARKTQAAEAERARQKREHALRESQQQQQHALEDMYQTSMEMFGSSHDAARQLQESMDFTQPDRRRAATAATKQRAADERHRLALRRLREMNDLKQSEKSQRQAQREKALEVEKRRAAKLAEAYRKKSGGRPVEAELKKHGDGATTLGKGRVELVTPRFVAKDVGKYAGTYFHFKQPPTMNASVRAPKQQVDARVEAQQEAKRFASDQQLKDDRSSRIQDKTDRRGRRAANTVRLRRVKDEVEKELIAMERRDFDQRKAQLQHPASQVVEQNRRLEVESKRQQKLEQAFEAMYFSVTEPGGRTMANEQQPRVKLFVDNAGGIIPKEVTSEAVYYAEPAPILPSVEYGGLSAVSASASTSAAGECDDSNMIACPHPPKSSRSAWAELEQHSLRPAPAAAAAATTTVATPTAPAAPTPAAPGPVLGQRLFGGSGDLINRAEPQVPRPSFPETTVVAARSRHHLHDDLDLSDDIPAPSSDSVSDLIDDPYFASAADCITWAKQPPLPVAIVDADPNADEAAYAAPGPTVPTGNADPAVERAPETRDDVSHGSPDNLLPTFETLGTADLDIDSAWEQLLFGHGEFDAQCSDTTAADLSVHSMSEMDSCISVDAACDPTAETAQPVEVKFPPPAPEEARPSPYPSAVAEPPAPGPGPGSLKHPSTGLSDSGIQTSVNRWQSPPAAASWPDADTTAAPAATAMSIPDMSSRPTPGTPMPSIEQLKQRIIALEASMDLGGPRKTADHTTSATDAVPTPVDPVDPVARLPAASQQAGQLYPVKMAYMSDSSDEVETALENLVRKNALYVGHPTISRSKPVVSKPDLDRDREIAAAIEFEKTAAKPQQTDFGAKDYRISRVAEAHPFQDLHKLLPVWQGEIRSESGSAAAAGASLQDAFKRHKQGMIVNSKARLAQAREAAETRKNAPVTTLSKIAQERLQRQQRRQERVAPAASAAPSVEQHFERLAGGAAAAKPAVQLPPGLAPSARGKPSKRQILDRNKRLFNRLCPEVRQAKEHEAKEAEYAKNRAKAKAYGLAIRKQHQRRGPAPRS